LPDWGRTLLVRGHSFPPPGPSIFLGFTASHSSPRFECALCQGWGLPRDRCVPSPGVKGFSVFLRPFSFSFSPKYLPHREPCLSRVPCALRRLLSFGKVLGSRPPSFLAHPALPEGGLFVWSGKVSAFASAVPDLPAQPRWFPHRVLIYFSPFPLPGLSPASGVFGFFDSPFTPSAVFPFVWGQEKIVRLAASLPPWFCSETTLPSGAGVPAVVLCQFPVFPFFPVNRPFFFAPQHPTRFACAGPSFPFQDNPGRPLLLSIEHSGRRPTSSIQPLFPFF